MFMAQYLPIMDLILRTTETTMKISPKKKTPNPVKMAQEEEMEDQAVVM